MPKRALQTIALCLLLLPNLAAADEPHRVTEDQRMEVATLTFPLCGTSKLRARAYRSDSKTVQRAIASLNNGENQQTVEQLYEHFGLQLNVWALNPGAGTETQLNAVYAVALAVIRSNGRVARAARSYELPAEDRGGNLQWAVRALENVAMRTEVYERHQAEAWAVDPTLEHLALQKFADLDARGGLGKMQYRRYAELARAAGDEATAQIAIRKSEKAD